MAPNRALRTLGRRPRQSISPKPREWLASLACRAQRLGPRLPRPTIEDGAMTSHTQATVALNDGAAMPQFGLGVFQTPPDATERIVQDGRRRRLSPGRHRSPCIETRTASARPCVGRTDVFVTTKLGNSDHGFDEALRAFDASIEEATPRYARFVPDPLAAAAGQPLCRKLESVHPVCKRRGGSARSGSRISIAITSSGSSPRRESRQPSIRSSFTRGSSRRPCGRFTTRAGSKRNPGVPLGRGALLSEAAIVDIAAKHRKTPAQVVIRWHLDSGLIAIPKTVRLERLKENIAALDFRLDDDDMRRIEALDSPDGRIGPDPATAAF